MNKKKLTFFSILVVVVVLVVALTIVNISAAPKVNVSYDIQSDWGSGASINITLKNQDSSTIDGWTIEWSFPGNQKIAQMWGGSYTQSGANVKASNANWNAKINPGSSINFGFMINYSGSNNKPTNFKVNSNSSSTTPTKSAPNTTKTSSQPTNNPPAQPISGLIGWATTNGGTNGGGNSSPQRVTSMSQLKSLASSNSSKVLHLSGNFDTGSSALSLGSNTTLIGLGKNTTIKGGIEIRNKKNVIVKNLIIKGNGKGKSPADTISARGSSNLWFDHLEVSDAADGILDLTRGTDFATVSWCKFYYTDSSNSHRLALLFGGGSTHGSTDRGKNNHTIHHNWFSNLVKSRAPRLLFGKGHIFNNYYNSPGNNYCIGSGSWASLLVENNYFQNVKDPHRFQDSNPSYITAKGNIYDNTKGKKDTGLGGSGSNPPSAWTNPPYSYSLDPAKSVPNIVKQNAGPQ